jgi:hypothetical protein
MPSSHCYGETAFACQGVRLRLGGGIELTLATSNIASMLAPGGVFLHNEARPALDGISGAAGLPFEQSRHAVVARVRGAPAQLFDSVWLHRKADGPPP